jgi:hypothetical protein
MSASLTTRTSRSSCRSPRRILKWVHLFNAAVEEYEARGDRTVRATSREVTIIAMSGRAEAAPDWVSGIEARLDWVRETIDKTNVARRALEQRAEECAAKVEDWWKRQDPA